MRHAVRWMLVYAAVLVAGGVFAFAMSPDKGKATTALAIPGACAALMVLCAGLSALLPKSKAAGMVGIHLGMVLPLVFAAGLFMQGNKAWKELGRYREAQSAWMALPEPQRAGTDRATHFASFNAPDHSTWYKATALLGLGGASVVAFGLILAGRPKPAARD